MNTLLNIIFGFLAICVVVSLYVVGREIRTGLEESEWYDE